MDIKKIRYFIFLRDVAWLSITAFGGPDVHMTMFLKMFVEKRAYFKKEEFLELIALCRVLPGPSSTQLVTSLGFKIGGPGLAYLTLIVWSLPGVSLMLFFGLVIVYVGKQAISLEFLQFIPPMAVGFMCHAALHLAKEVIKTKTSFFLMTTAAVMAYLVRSPWVFPLAVVFGAAVTALKFKEQPKVADKHIRIRWENFILFWGVLVFAALLGALVARSSPFSLPIRLFENFYRNGSFIYGGGQVLIPVLLTEFVLKKKYLSQDEFLSGYGFSPFVPGPVFSFSAYIGVMAMRDYGIGGQILGGLMASAGLFLPGTFLIFFVIRFWENLKKFRGVKASLEGINASSAGLAIAAPFVLFNPMHTSLLDISFVMLTFLILQFTKIPHPILVLFGLLMGVVFQYFK